MVQASARSNTKCWHWENQERCYSTIGWVLAFQIVGSSSTVGCLILIGWSTRQKKRTKRKVALDLKVSLVYSFDLKVSGCIAQKQVSSLCLSLTSFALFFPSLTRPKGLVRSGIYSTVRSLSFTHSHSFE